MSDQMERRMAALLSQISEMIESRLPPDGIKGNAGLAMWQFWLAIGTLLFYSGVTWIQIQNNAAAIEEHSRWDKEKTSELSADIKGNRERMVSHMQWELSQKLKMKDKEINELKGRR